MSTDAPSSTPPDLPILPDLTGLEPHLELDESALHAPSERPGPSFRVRVGPVRDPVATAPALVDILGVDLPTAQKIAVNAPGVILSQVARPEAEKTASALEALGLRATVEDESTPERPVSERPPSLRPPSLRPSARPPSERPPGSTGPGIDALDREPGTGPGDGFWVQAPVAFVAPVLGRGPWLLVVSGMAGVGVGLMVMVPGLLLKLGALIGVQLVAFGIFVEIFDRLAQAATFRDDDAWLPEPRSELPNATALFYRGVVNVLVFAMLAAPAVAFAIYTRSATLALVAQVALFVYWPMALTVQSLSGRLAGPLDVVSVLRGIIAAPLEYLCVCLLTFGAIAGSTFVVAALTGAGALALGASGGGLGSGAAFYMGVAFVWYAAIGYFHGVLGYLMGSLVRSKSERFTFLEEG